MPTFLARNHKVPMGENTTQRQKWEQGIVKIFTELFATARESSVESYNLDGKKNTFNAGGQNRFLVFANNTPHEAQGETIEVNANVKIGGEAIRIGTLLPVVGRGVVVKDDDGNFAIAEYFPDWNELHIFFDIFGKYLVKNEKAFRHIVEQAVEEKLNANSWKKSKQKDALAERIKARERANAERELSGAKEKVESYRRQINEYMVNLKQRHDQLRAQMKIVDAYSVDIDTEAKRILSDLDTIANHPKVADVLIEDNYYIIKTVPLYIHTENGKRYYGGNYTIRLRPEQSEIRFFGDNPRQGYWTPSDPHPHVDGSHGSACLGSISGTIAELSSAKELYALALVGIDFLENANIQDSAGRKVTNWDEVDEDGNILRPGSDDDDDDIPEFAHTCPRCEQGTDDLHTVYRFVAVNEQGQPYGEEGHEVCEECRDEHFHYDDTIDGYIED